MYVGLATILASYKQYFILSNTQNIFASFSLHLRYRSSLLKQGTASSARSPSPQSWPTLPPPLSSTRRHLPTHLPPRHTVHPLHPSHCFVFVDDVRFTSLLLHLMPSPSTLPTEDIATYQRSTLTHRHIAPLKADTHTHLTGTQLTQARRTHAQSLSPSTFYIHRQSIQTFKLIVCSKWGLKTIYSKTT